MGEVRKEKEKKEKRAPREKEERTFGPSFQTRPQRGQPARHDQQNFKLQTHNPSSLVHHVPVRVAADRWVTSFWMEFGIQNQKYVWIHQPSLSGAGHNIFSHLAENNE
jgi:hypothetical protein